MSCMADTQTPAVKECTVARLLLRVEKSGRLFEVEHGPDDLNMPDESFPLRVRIVEESDDDWFRAGTFIGSTSIFAMANAFIEQKTRRRVPRQETARDARGVSHHRGIVRVVTESDEEYRLVFDTTDVSFPLVECQDVPGDRTSAPATIIDSARHELQGMV